MRNERRVDIHAEAVKGTNSRSIDGMDEMALCDVLFGVHVHSHHADFGIACSYGWAVAIESVRRICVIATQM